MRNLIYLFLLFIIFIISACNSSRIVYWCGDHPCINKKEKEAYFKKTMIVEAKELSEIKDRKNEIEKIMKQARTNEKNRIIKEKDNVKEAKLERKRKIKREKALAKQIKVNEKKRIKEEKALARQIRRDEKKVVQKKIKIQNQNVEADLRYNTINSNKFSEIVERIVKRNIFKPYPNINDMPN